MFGYDNNAPNRCNVDITILPNINVSQHHNTTDPQGVSQPDNTTDPQGDAGSQYYRTSR